MRVEDGVPIAPASATMVFAIDGAVAKARTAAFFSNDQAPLTSRTVRFISQSTMTQREVESNPNAADPTVQGPGFVAPIGLGGHFPPDVQFTPHVDLFAIEHTNRDSVIHPGENGIRRTDAGDDVPLTSTASTSIAAFRRRGSDDPAPESYGFVSGILPDGARPRHRHAARRHSAVQDRSRLDNTHKLVGGIGVFFPGPTASPRSSRIFSTATSAAAAKIRRRRTSDSTRRSCCRRSTWRSRPPAASARSRASRLPAGYVLPMGRIDLAGITLEFIGPHPGGATGLDQIWPRLGDGSLVGGINVPVNTRRRLANRRQSCSRRLARRARAPAIDAHRGRGAADH